MKPRSEKWEQLLALFVVGFIILNFPVLVLFDTHRVILGIPALHFYLFSIWGLVIIISAWIIEQRR